MQREKRRERREEIGNVFKVIRELVETPVYWLVCDHRSCSMAMTGPMDMTDKEKLRESQKVFVLAAQQSGWLIGLDAQLCPAHAAALNQPQEKKLITLPGSVPGVGKLRGERAEENVRRIHGGD